MNIQTVRGLLPQEKLGFCHSHEHLFLAQGHPATVNPDLRIDDYALTVQELLAFREAGGEAIIDAQPLGSGRMESELIRASEETGIHIVASTGFHKLLLYDEGHWIHRYTTEELRDVFTSELTTGMFVGTDASDPGQRITGKAGIIKTAVDAERMRDPDKRWFEAAADAAKATGATLLCHIESAEQAEWLCDYYESHGIAPEKIVICHLDRKLDRPEVHRKLADRGIYLEYDTIGRYKYHSDEAEAKWISGMLESGHEDRLLLGLDTTRARLRSYGGAIGLTHMAMVFLPMLREFGATEKQIRKMMIDNPAQAFVLGK
ncbi:phosphotriesterase-related protein [Paenibacillus phyllosphaerae]|uniref:Phosphotriesterase-related protein n=1 Tax=Paenibacillus phyllosphaerae TaxID=274593 RepID=A0A7W5AZC5_9BACL|nr:hypothetical protein [Paenibacillus phyllosphaerae]MBB3111046.1 phosphotriesterase-related protein [Paenibacillus phyllosphaerae]